MSFLEASNTTDPTNYDDDDDETMTLDSSRMSSIALPVAVGIVGLSVGISLELQDFCRIRKQPLAVCLGLVCQLVLVPSIGWLLTLIFDIQKELAVGCILLTLCPGGSSSNYVSVVAGGDGALSVSLTAVSSIVTTFTIPVFLDLAIRHFMKYNNDGNGNGARDDDLVDIDIAEIMLNIAMLTIFPILVGMLIKYCNEALARKLQMPLKVVAGLLLTAMIVAYIVTFRTLVRDAFSEITAPTLVLIVCMVCLSYGLAWTARLGARQCITICIESSIQYSGLAVTIGLTMLDTLRNAQGQIIFDPEKVIMPAAVYTVFLYPFGVGVIIFCWWRKGDLDFLMISPCRQKQRTDSDGAATRDMDQDEDDEEEAQQSPVKVNDGDDRNGAHQDDEEDKKSSNDSCSREYNA